MDDRELTDMPFNRMLGGRKRELVEVDTNQKHLLDVFNGFESSDVIPDFLTAGKHLTILYADTTSINTGGGFGSRTHSNY